MAPTAIVCVLALAGPLDSPRYADRARARRVLEAVEPAAGWPAVWALARHPSAEVSQAAEQCAARRYGRWLVQEFGDLPEPIRLALTRPISERPWRALHAYLHDLQRRPAGEDDECFARKWGPVAAKHLHRLYPGEYATEFDRGMKYADPCVPSIAVSDHDAAGCLVGMIFDVRAGWPGGRASGTDW